MVIAEGLSPEQVRAYRVADNRTHDYTTWDYGILAQELDGMPDDLARVLDLADWQAVMAAFAEQGADDLGLVLPGDASALVTGRHTVTVIFDTQAHADLAGPAILRLPGVLDVRHSR